MRKKREIYQKGYLHCGLVGAWTYQWKNRYASRSTRHFFLKQKSCIARTSLENWDANNPLATRAHFYTPLTGVCALYEADSSDRQMSGLFCVTPFRTRGCTPCDACASIPAHFAAEIICWCRQFPPQSLKIPCRKLDRLLKT